MGGTSAALKPPAFASRATGLETQPMTRRRARSADTRWKRSEGQLPPSDGCPSAELPRSDRSKVGGRRGAQGVIEGSVTRPMNKIVPAPRSRMT